jgi:nickel transport protein
MRRLLFAIALMVINASPAFGHGVSYGMAESKALTVFFAYTGSEPMSYVPVLVFGPQSTPDLEYQNGRTDAQGKFAFVPDRSGEWRVEASDGTGHKGVMTVTVTEDMLTSGGATSGDAAYSAARSAGTPPMAERTILGLSLLANLCLAGLLLRKRKG